MKYLKTFESFKTNEVLDFMTFPADITKGSSDMWSDIWNSISDKLSDISDAIKGGLNSLKEAIEEFVKGIIEEFGGEKIAISIKKMFDSNENLQKIVTVTQYATGSTTWGVEPIKRDSELVKFLKSLNWEDIKKKVQEKWNKFKERMKDDQPHNKPEGITQKFLSFLLSILNFTGMANLISCGVGAKLILFLNGINMTLLSVIGWSFVITLASVLILLLSKSLVFALSGGSIK